MNRSLNQMFARWQIRVLVLLGQRQAALDRLDAWLQNDSANVYALATQAHLLAEMGDKPRALLALQRQVALQPQAAPGWFNLGFLSEEMGLLEQAEDAFRRALDIDPRLDRAWYGLALRKNTELQPMSPYGWYQLARVHVDRQEPEEAAKIIRHLRGFEPKVAAQLERETGLGTSRA